MLIKYLVINCLCWIILCVQSEQIDKSIDLFTSSLNQYKEIKLKCKFNNTFDESAISQQVVDQDESDYLNLSSHDTEELIDWFKLNESGNYYVKLTPNEVYQFDNHNKYSSSLKIKQNFKSIQGVYLCKLKNQLSTNLTKYNSQFIQKISVNEVVNSIDQFLDYKLLQINSSKVLIEFNLTQNKKQIIYSLINLNTTVPVLHGNLITSNLTKSYLILDGLSPKTKYSLVFKLNQAHQSFNITLETRSRINKAKFRSAFDLIQSISKNGGDENTEYDDEDDEEEEYTDEYYEDEYNDQTSFKSNDKITTCDIAVLSNIVTIDYSSAKMNKMLISVFKNKSIDLSDLTSQVNTFTDFFTLVQFNSDKIDYSVYNQCIRDYRQTKLIQSKPLCLFSLDHLWYVSSQDHFSVHTTLNVSNTNIFIASTCKRTPELTLYNNNGNTKSIANTSSRNKLNEIQTNKSSPRLFETKPLNITYCRINNNYLTFGLNHLSDAYIHFVNYRQSIPDGLIYSIEIKFTNDTKLSNKPIINMNKHNNSLQIIRLDFPNNSIAKSKFALYLAYKTYYKSNSSTDRLNESENETIIKHNCTMNSVNASVFSNSASNNGFTNSKLSLLIAALSAIILLMVSMLICVIVKRKYGLNSDYLLSLKNNLLFKSRNDSTDNNNNTMHSSILNFKKSKHKTIDNSYTSNQQPQYQLQTNNYTNPTAITQVQNTEMMSKNPTFNYVDNEAISADLFDTYVQRMHIDGDFGFAQLYEEISNATRSYSYSSEVSLLDYNRCKNRYSNILTYDHSRVKLSHDEKDETGGYINANYVDGYQKQNAYIATQGPMPNTFGDFWRMIWEKNCSIVVMITNVKEKGRIKCDQYWPDEGFEIYGNIQVTHLHTICLAFYTKRIFTIKIKNAKKRTNSERLVYQYHFTDWPDHGVPYYIMPVLSFIKKSSRANPELGGPIVVHCSAGVGRTGTYIVIDAMMNQIKHKSTVNIHSFLKHIRHQRNYLVQTEEQFIFIYDCILEWIKSGETDLTEHNYKSYLNGLLRVLNENGLKLLDKQFELISEFKPKDYQVSAAHMPFNLNKNRSQQILPVNNSRVVLSKKPGIDGSEYINATYLHGSSRQDEFIITQYPIDETKNSFWQMVWDNNSNQIVILNADDTEQCDFYWLPLGEPMKCDSFTVILKEENFDMDFVIRDFLLQSIDEDYEFHCRMISACYWPDSCAPIKTSFDLINKVRYYRSTSLNLSQNAHVSLMSPPIIVHDLLGGSRAATFCALYTFQDLIQLECSVNVYELAKMYHLKRPGIWSGRTNIMFLYEAVECLFDDLHLNNQFSQSKINNIENIFNQTHLQHQQSQLSSNNISNNNKSMPSSNQTNTLPNISNFLINTQPNVQSMQPQRHHSNDAIGSRIQNFQKQRDDLLDPLSAIPLTNHNPKQEQLNIMLLNSPIINDLEAIAIDTNLNSTNTKTSFMSDIPKMFPSFLTHHSTKASSDSNTKRSFIRHFNRRSSGASNTSSRKVTNGLNNTNTSSNSNNRAIKFMNSVLTKSASFKRALFSQNQPDVIEQQTQQQTSQLEPKPSMMIALASASSSSSSGSSNTVVQTTTESSLSSKSTNLVQVGGGGGNSSSYSVSPNSVNNINTNMSSTKTNAMSNTNLNASTCSINTPTTTISQLNKTTSQTNLKI